MGPYRLAMVAIAFKWIVETSVSSFFGKATSKGLKLGAVCSNANRYFSYGAMAAELPKDFKHHFRFAEYNRIDRIRLLEATDGKYGHLFGDNLMQNSDFQMHMYLNTTKTLAADANVEPKVTEVRTDGFDDAICFGQRRNYVAEFIYIIDVGALCCGHKGIWHGGVTSALFDNAFGILGCSILPLAVTKYLNIRFKAPVMVGDTVALVVSFDPEQFEGEKMDRFVAHGKMYNQNGVVVATGESELVDVSAKWAKKQKTGQNGE
ncbi:thioesterase family protein, putative [Babesia ovata]|uniref:Thioesterase family protein, putative n=1 Tax=Babesia ovata TaxID=189622 RepID=A0A2H6KEA6_9APIC|nr:thioesterase family protein, putative [Babesia ovata]GBE61331.1 thioesterase family protein, putative [Babesia ovata]